MPKHPFAGIRTGYKSSQTGQQYPLTARGLEDGSGPGIQHSSARLQLSQVNLGAVAEQGSRTHEHASGLGPEAEQSELSCSTHGCAQEPDEIQIDWPRPQHLLQCIKSGLVEDWVELW